MSEAQEIYEILRSPKAFPKDHVGNGMTLEHWLTGMALTAAAEVSRYERGGATVESVASYAQRISTAVLVRMAADIVSRKVSDET